MDATWIEQDCTLTHEGRTYTSTGAVVTPEHIVAYLGHGMLTDWHGNKIGSYRITSRWPLVNAWQKEMCQVEAVVNGITYTGRSCVVGFMYRGKRKRTQG
jgi:hypothetical protein